MMRFWKFRYGLPLLVHSVWIVSPVVGDPCDSAAPAAAAFAACCCAPAAFAAAPERTAQQSVRQCLQRFGQSSGRLRRVYEHKHRKQASAMAPHTCGHRRRLQGLRPM